MLCNVYYSIKAKIIKGVNVMGKYFWETSESIPDGLGFSAYGPLHFAWIGAFIISAVLLSLIYRRLDDGKRNLMLKIMALLIFADELGKYFLVLYGHHSMLDYLPLHLCSINIYVILYHAWFAKSDRVKEIIGNFLYALCMPAALAAILCPTWTRLPITSFMHIHSFTVHIMLFIYPLLLLAGGLRPRFSVFRKAILPLCGVAVLVFVFNKIFDTEYMFLNGAGTGNPLSFFEGLWGNPGYLASIPLLFGAVWSIMFGIPALWRRKVDK